MMGGCFVEGSMRIRSLLPGFLAIAGLLVVSGARGGTQYGFSGTYVNTSSRYAYGQAGSARASSNSNEYLGCVTYVSGTALSGYCRASDPSGNAAYCYFPSSGAAQFAQAAATASVNSYYYFSWDTNSNCTFLEVDNTSYWLPLTP
jgi:hypothetical protein